ncbi:MAG: undecaprenyldiphospho-muramoylpentapeptide beta-N-acetylglucosaminyltransferase [Desulfonatronovibrionaceae bacterium]
MLSRVILTTGGTGGHIFPAIAVARKLKERYPGCRVVFAGGEYGPEKEMADQAGLEFKAFPARGVLGRGFKSLGSLFWMGKSLVSSLFFLRSFKPQVVLGFGGYAGFMPVLAARILKIPTAVHEQNSLPGVTNRILGKRVDQVFLSFPDEQGFFPGEKVTITGNPVREELIRLQDIRTYSGRMKRLLVLGGSQGAKGINDAVLACLGQFKAMGVEIWHQAGAADYERVKYFYDRDYPEARVDIFIENMAEAYGFAALVLCRAGASTLAELCVAGRPSVLIPFPYATHDHQMSNARYLEKKGAAMVLAQSHLSGMNIAGVIGDLLAMPEKLREMSRAALAAGRPEASGIIVEHLKHLSIQGRK